jgi:hypothetical protein
MFGLDSKRGGGIFVGKIIIVLVLVGALAATWTWVGGSADFGPRCDLHSRASSTPVQLAITNKLNSSVDVHWMDFEGRPVHYFQPAAGERIVQQTCVAHPWCVASTADGTIIRAIDMDSVSTRVTLC